MGELEIPISMIYPTFSISQNRGVIPDIPLPVNYKELVKEFYKFEGKKEVERYKDGLVKSLNNLEKPIDIELDWDNELGLAHIGVGIHGGLDLNDSVLPNFQEHNLGGLNSLYAAAIATKYISELLKLSE